MKTGACAIILLFRDNTYVDYAFDLFKNVPIKAEEEADGVVRRKQREIKFPKAHHVEALCFSPNGEYFVTGTKDGFIEVWDYMTGKIRKDLTYQAQDAMMLMEGAVLCLSFDQESLNLASGDSNGKIKVWDIKTGKCVQRMKSTHSKGVTSVIFRSDGNIVSSSLDNTIKVSGVKTGLILKEYRGHTSWVNIVRIFEKESRLASGSSDGTVRIWNAQTAECLSVVKLHDGGMLKSSMNLRSVHTVIHLGQGNLLVGNHGKHLYIINLKGELVQVLHDDQVQGEYTMLEVSGHHQYIYGITDQYHLVCFDRNKGLKIADFNVSDADVVDINHHPFSNILAISSANGMVTLWS